METLDELILKKVDRLTTVPDALLSGISKSELEALKKIQELIKELKTSGGYIIQSEENLRIASEIVDKLKQVFYGGQYIDAVASFANEFDNQVGISNQYFERAFDSFTIDQFAIASAKAAKKTAVELLVSALPDTELFNPIKSVLEEAVSSGARYLDTLDALQPYLSGKDGGALSRYATTYAHDTFAIADRSYTNVVSDHVNAVWFKYSGGTVKHTRPFCLERHEKYFHYKEIEGWVEGKRVAGERTPDSSGKWAGMVEGTSKQTIFTYAGGWNCRHSIIPVSAIRVPEEVLLRNIQSGNFKPTDKEKRLLKIN